MGFWCSSNSSSTPSVWNHNYCTRHHLTKHSSRLFQKFGKITSLCSLCLFVREFALSCKCWQNINMSCWPNTFYHQSCDEGILHWTNNPSFVFSQNNNKTTIVKETNTATQEDEKRLKSLEQFWKKYLLHQISPKMMLILKYKISHDIVKYKIDKNIPRYYQRDIISRYYQVKKY